MSRDLLVIHAPEEIAPESPTQNPRIGDGSRASTLVEDLLKSVEREWSVSHPHTESLWQLAGE